MNQVNLKRHEVRVMRWLRRVKLKERVFQCWRLRTKIKKKKLRLPEREEKLQNDWRKPTDVEKKE